MSVSETGQIGLSGNREPMHCHGARTCLTFKRHTPPALAQNSKSEAHITALDLARRLEMTQM